MSVDAMMESSGGAHGALVFAAVAPLHLRGADRIAQQFGVKRQTVVQWKKSGAPMALVGRTYMAEYSALMAWLVAKTRESGGR